MFGKKFLYFRSTNKVSKKLSYCIFQKISRFFLYVKSELITTWFHEFPIPNPESHLNESCLFQDVPLNKMRCNWFKLLWFRICETMWSSSIKPNGMFPFIILEYFLLFGFLAGNPSLTIFLAYSLMFILNEFSRPI